MQVNRPLQYKVMVAGVPGIMKVLGEVREFSGVTFTLL